MNEQDRQLLADTATFICTKQWNGAQAAPPDIKKYLDIQQVYDANIATIELRGTHARESLYWGNRLIPDRRLRENQDKQQYGRDVRSCRRGSRLRLPTADQIEQLQNDTDELATSKYSIAKRRRPKRRDEVHRVREPLLDRHRHGVRTLSQLARLDAMLETIWQAILHCYLQLVLKEQRTVGEDRSLFVARTLDDIPHRLYDAYSKQHNRLSIYIGSPSDPAHGHVVTDDSGTLVYSRLYGAPRSPRNYTAAFYRPLRSEAFVA